MRFAGWVLVLVTASAPAWARPADKVKPGAEAPAPAAAPAAPAPAKPAPAPAPPPKSAIERSPWWNDAWSHRRVITVGDASKGATPRNVAFADLPTLGVARPDGHDLRVIDADGKELPVQVLAAGFEDRALVAFPAAARASVLLYFGNPRASAPKAATIQAGLVLESRALGEGNPADWPSMQKLLDRSPKVNGRWMRSTIALGFNPLGPWDNGIFLFTGWLECPVDGAYGFATNALDASFLLVDDRLVAEWPGWHGPHGGAGGEHQGKIDLKKGLHRIQYVNAFRAHGACTVGWQKPGEERLSPIPAEAFAGVYLATAGPAETRGGPVPDFAWGFEDDLGYEGRPVTAVRFRPLGRTAGAVWNFGDGVTSTEEAPLHLYLEAATVPVTMTLGGAAVTQKIAVRPTRGHLNRSYEQRIVAYADLLKDYPVAGLSGAACLEMGQICHEGRKFDAAIRAIRGAMEKGYRTPQSEPEEVWYNRLFELYRDQGKFDDALWVCERLLLNPHTESHMARSLYMKATVLFEDKGDAAGAEACLKEILGKYARAGTDYVRFAFIRSGELALLRGEREAARKTLEDAEVNPAWRRWAGDFDVSEGAHAINFEEYLRQNEFDAAGQEILSWEWQKPTVILGGLSRHLRGRLYLARKWYDRALREFDRALAADPKAPFADEALVWKGAALEGLKQNDKARACYETVIRQFPESQLVAMAREKLEKLK
jgi:tetratricopeptide (TPR) repeat protein